jgi:HD-like signal output (HDOD) protein
MDTAPAFITRAPGGLAAWMRCFDPADLPVLARSLAAVHDWGEDEDRVQPRHLADVVALDPLFTLKLLAHVAALRRDREGGEVETVTEALVMMGVPPFFRRFSEQQTVEATLAQQPMALAGFEAVLRRAHRAAAFATSFAAHRLDPDAAVIAEAALLHDFAELLLWARAPALALAIQARQQAEPGLRSAQVQRQLLGVELPALQHALMLAWRLPRLLVRITDDHAAADAQVRCVQLAVRVARHSARGWHNPALPDDVCEVAALLNISAEPALRLLHTIDEA